MSYLEEFKKSVEKNNYTRFLQLWEEYCYSDKVDGEEFKNILLSVKNSELAKPFGHHVSRALLLWNTLSASDPKHEIIKLIFDIQTINNEDLAETALLYLQERYPNDPYFDYKLRLIGLKTMEDFQGAISYFELLTHLDKGKFVFHTAGWGTGEVIDLSLLREEVSLEFEYVIGTKTLSLTNAMKTLIPLSMDHFLARRFGDPDKLEAEAKENPSEIIHILLRDLGPKTASEIKDELSDLVIPSEEWSRWWTTLRGKLKKDKKIECPKSSNDKFQLLTKEITYEEALYKDLEAKPSIDQIIQLVHSFLKDFPQSLKNLEFKQNLSSRLSALLEFKEIKDFQKIQIFLLLEDLSDQNLASSYIKTVSSFDDLLAEIEIISLKKRILQKIRETRKDWSNLFFHLLFIIQPTVLKDYVFSELYQDSESQNKLESHIKELLHHSLVYPHAFFWYFTKLIDSTEPLPFSDIHGKKSFFEGLLILLSHIEQKDIYRELAKKIANMVTKQKYQLIRFFIENGTLEEVKEYLLLVSKCHTLSQQDLKIIVSLSEVVFPSLKYEEKKEEKGTEKKIIWTTVEAFNKIRQKIQELATTETLKNAKEIEEARAHGDLRENAEYKAALEKRQQIQNELKKLTELFNCARILKKEDVSTENVGVGCVVTCQNPIKESLTFVILGPWDAEPENNILSFQSQLAQSMMGLSIGEKFRFHGEDFTIKQINNYFD